MRFVWIRSLLVMVALSIPLSAMAESIMTETFTRQPETRWRFFADTVMGGVSKGQVAFLTEGERAFARMTGTVSTENNGGFIQFRMALPEPPPDRVSGVRLIVRGNDQRYFVHLRTGGAVLPWQYYQAGFDVTRKWAEVRLPFTEFERSGRLLRKVPEAGSLKSIGVVAFGRDHAAEVDVLEIGFY